MKDASTREWLYFVPLVVGVLWLGIHPTSLTASLSPSVEKLLVHIQTPLAGNTAEPVADAPADENLPLDEWASMHDEVLSEEDVPQDEPEEITEPVE